MEGGVVWGVTKGRKSKSLRTEETQEAKDIRLSSKSSSSEEEASRSRGTAEETRSFDSKKWSSSSSSRRPSQFIVSVFFRSMVMVHQARRASLA